MKKLTNLSKFKKLNDKKVADILGGRPPIRPADPIRFPTGTIGTYIDGVNVGHDGSRD